MMILGFACLLAVASAKPQGYSYPAPTLPASGRPGGSFGGGGSQGFHSGSFNGGNGLVGGNTFSSSQSFNGGNSLGQSFTGGNGFVGGNTFSSGQSFTGSSFSSGGTSGFSTGGVRGQVASNFGGSQQPLIQKHIYVHVAPPELEESVQSRVVGSAGQSQKHYKIIFIKTPSYNLQQQQILQQQAQNQEKTLIYVLVKKPEDQQQFNIQQANRIQPSKPEVYFIKYKANQKTTATGGNVNFGTSGGSVGTNVISSGTGGSTGTGSGTIVTNSFGSGTGSIGSSGSFDGGSSSIGSSSGSFGTGTGVQGVKPVYGPPEQVGY